MREKLLAALCALSCLALPLDAFARSQPGVLGNPNQPADATCFDDGIVGVRNACAGAARFWSIPVVWDTPGGPKTISIGATVQGNGALSCTYRGMGPTGLLVHLVNFPAFPVGVTIQSINVPNVPGGSIGHIACSVSASNTATIHSVNYVTP